MSVLRKVVSALKGNLNEAGEAFVESQALRILDQEVRDADEELKESKNNLVTMIARQKLAEKRYAEFQVSISDHETYALKAIEQGDEALARDVAVNIASMEIDEKAQSIAAGRYAEDVTALRAVVKSAERDIGQLKQQVDTVRATESVQRAQATVSQRHGGSSTTLQTAIDSLNRIREREDMQSAQMQATRDLACEAGATSLDERLEAAGIKPSASNADLVLARLKKRQ